VPEGLKPVYVHRQSRTLSKVLAELLRASNNCVANQVFLEIGGHRLGGPVSLEKSLKVANEMLAAHGLAAAIDLEEGSGISRDNRFTARGLAKVLELFAPHTALLHGHDGGDEQDRHHGWDQHTRGLRRHHKPWPDPFCDLTHNQ
jgi:serine-type D-Ala-D-Ala carboxypeptidase/endopeptidase (penicillin-binding protein 4)